MSNRISRKMVEAKFEQWANKMQECNAGVAEGDKFALDYSSYGGYMVVIVDNSNGAHWTPFGYTRRPARDMFEVLNFALTCLYRTSGERHGK